MTRDQIEATLKQFGRYGQEDERRKDAVIEQLQKELALLKAGDADQRLVIEDLQKRVEELIDHRNNFHREVVEWRGIEFYNVCTECNGSGYKVYGNTTTYHHGAGGQVITTSVCNTCWGSGDKSRPWTSWLQIEQQAQKIARLENGLGCSRSHPHEDMNQICELRTEVARLNNELSQRTNLEGSAPCWNSAHMKQIATLREALRWDGLKVSEENIQWALKELGPAGTRAEAYVQAVVEFAIHMRRIAQQALKEVKG